MKEKSNLFWYKNSCRKRSGGGLSSCFLPGGETEARGIQGAERGRGVRALGHGVFGCRRHAGYPSGMGKVWPHESICLRAPLGVPPLQGPVWGGFRLPLHDLEHQDHTPQYQIHPRRVLWETGTGVSAVRPPQSSSTHTPSHLFAVRLTSPSAPLNRSLVGTLRSTDVSGNLYPRTSLQHCVGWSRTAEWFHGVSMEFSELQSSCEFKRQL